MSDNRINQFTGIQPIVRQDAAAQPEGLTGKLRKEFSKILDYLNKDVDEQSQPEVASKFTKEELQAHYIKTMAGFLDTSASGDSAGTSTKPDGKLG